MHVFLREDVIVAFSEASDGDLSFYKQDETLIKNAWSQLGIVRDKNLQLPRWLKQVHGDKILEVTKTSLPGLQGEGDALVTLEQGLPIGVFTADCLPVLIWNEKLVAAVHAGWKGTLLDIVGKSIDFFSKTYCVSPASLKAAMGPCIGSCCLEMGADVAHAFYEADAAYAAFFSRGVKHHLDLRGLNAAQALNMGMPIKHIEHVNDCTMCFEERYFSYRRQKGRKGGMFSFICRI